MYLRRLVFTAKLFALALVLDAAAFAYPIVYQVSGTFNDGGTVSGTFTYDAATNMYSNVHITTTSGTIRTTGATYSFVCGQDVPSCVGVTPNATGYLNLTTNGANQTGLPAMSLFYNSSLTNVGTVQQNIFGLEANCSNANCAAPAGPTRTLITSLLVSVPFPATLDGSFQSKIFPNLSAGDSVINIGNTGASAATSGAFGTLLDGNLCVNVYVFSPDEQEVACCTCAVTPNGVQTVSARQLVSKTLTPAVPTAITVKLLATPAPTTGACNAAVPGAPAIGLLAFGTNLHAAVPGGSVSAGTFQVTETPFTPATLSAAEFSRITTLCGFIGANGTGFGICPGCTAGAAGASRQ